MTMADTDIYNTAIVNKKYNGWRIDKFLTASFPDISRSQIQRLLNEGNVSCNGAVIEDNSCKVRENETYQLIIPEPEDAVPEPEDIPLEIVYEDDDLVVVNKPAGMTVHPAPGSPRGTLVNALLHHCQGRLSGIGGVKRPGIVHRIDKDTSGLLVVAKNDTAHKNLCEQFARHSIERTYYALVFGVPNPTNGRIETLIGRSPYDRKKMAIVKKNGKNAITNYKTLEVFKSLASLVQCNLETGRTHQIRVHMKYIGHTLFNDARYGGNEILKGTTFAKYKQFVHNCFELCPRQALHAKTLGFVHPSTGETLFFDSELPADMTALIDRWRTYAGSREVIG